MAKVPPLAMKKLLGKLKRESISAAPAVVTATPPPAPAPAPANPEPVLDFSHSTYPPTFDTLVPRSPVPYSGPSRRPAGHAPSTSSVGASTEPFVAIDVPPFFPDASDSLLDQQYSPSGMTFRSRPYSYVPPGPQRPATPPGNKPLWRDPGTRIKPEELRELRELVRQRYHLDHEIWNERFFRERDRDVTWVKMKKADALLDKIQRIVSTWDNPDYWDPHVGHHERFQKIRERLLKDGKRRWEKEPPWAEPRESRSRMTYQTFQG